MKNQILLSALCLALTFHQAISQNNPELLAFSEYVEMNGVERDVLYETAKDIFEQKYNNSHYHLRMNKNSGLITGGGVHKVSKTKGDVSQLNFIIALKLSNNGYELKVKDFHYVTIDKKGRKVKHFIESDINPGEKKKVIKMLNQLKVEANTMAQLIHEDIRKEMFDKLQTTTSDVNSKTAINHRTSW